MRIIDRIYIDGSFVTPHGEEIASLYNPSTEEEIGTVRLGDHTDALLAVAAARRAFHSFSRTTKSERIGMLKRLSAAVASRAEELSEAMALEYGAPQYFVGFSVPHSASVFLDMAETLAAYDFTRQIGRAEVTMQPLGVVAAITPWNSNYGFICSKLATAIAAGCTIVIKPSEMSAVQTDLLTECLHEAGLPPGVFNIVTGRGDVVKRVTLELGGKGPNIILDDADLDKVIPIVLTMGLANSGQACVAGTRILAPESRLAEILSRLKSAVEAIKTGDPRDSNVRVGPMVSQKQYDRVQSYIRLGSEEGAELLAGGEGRPEGIERGWFVRPTVFAGVTNEMRIAREEIFGPVLCVIPYRDEEQAVAIANDTSYGLQAYVHTSGEERARHVADRLQSGRVVINGAPHEPLAPFGGFKQSGIGREYGVFGLETHLEPRAVLV